MYNAFIVGEKVLVTRGERRGWIGEVSTVTRISGGLVDLGIVFPTDKTLTYSYPSEDCRPVDRPELERYLTEEEKRNILYRAYCLKAEEMISEAIKNRTLGSSLTDQVLAVVADKFIKENFDGILPFMIHRFETVIKSDKPLVEDGDSKSFAESIQWNLERAAADYIENNKETIWSLMSDTIYDIAKKMSVDQFIKIISDKIGKDFKKELETTINKDLEE